MCIAGFSITENFLKTASFAIKLPAVFGEKHCNEIPSKSNEFELESNENQLKSNDTYLEINEI